jgi:hypothetical protein
VDIFRRSGDPHLVQALLFRIKQSSSTLQDFFTHHEAVNQLDMHDEVHVLASTYMACLRELKEPLFPQSLYEECLRSVTEASQLLELWKKLDKTRCKVVVHIVTFLQVNLNARCEQATQT